MRVLVTGGKGFIGAWIIRRLHRRGITVAVLDVAEDPRLITAIAGLRPHLIDWCIADIVDSAAVKRAADGCDAIIHLAGILTPACAADPIRGAQINLLGTLNVFETARAHGISRVIYTSSAGVFGPDDGTTPHPTTHYGTFKLACEGSARAYWADHGLASIGFRPFIVYGPGREIGLTAGPTLACRAAARREAYTIPYSGTAGLIYADDVASAYEAALLRAPDGAHVFNLIGDVVSNQGVIAAIRRVVPNAAITAGGPPLPITGNVDPGNVDKFLSNLQRTALDDGIAATIAFYQSHPQL